MSSPLSKNIKSYHYPWSQKQLNKFNPFPLHGLSVSDRTINNELFLFGGFKNEKATNELFAIDVNDFTVVPVTTASGDIPRPRIFGGGSERPGDKLDDNIYIFDTETKYWSKRILKGHPPNGLIGHSISLIGSVVYIFGGQNGIKYFNDIVTFDVKVLKLQRKRSRLSKFSLNRASSSGSHWTYIVPNKSDHSVPSCRSGHTACEYKENIY
ncbi:7626_t:CDS:2, partial [Scutellospora calospora]